MANPESLLEVHALDLVVAFLESLTFEGIFTLMAGGLLVSSISPLLIERTIR